MITRRVAVVGAGPAGLAAANRLVRSGCDVQLFDGGGAGGLMRTIRDDGWTAEAGAHTVVSSDPAVGQLVDELHLGDEVIHASPDARRRYVVHHDRAVEVPLTPGELVASPLLSLRGRLRLLKEPFVARRADGDDETVDGFARRRFGGEVASRIIDPIASSSTGGDTHSLLARALFPAHVEYERAGGSVLRGAMRAGMQARRTRAPAAAPWTCRSGLGELARALLRSVGEERLRIAHVDRVTIAPDGLIVEAGGRHDAFDAVVFAIPPAALAAIDLVGIDRDAVTLVGSMPCASVVSVSLGYGRGAVGHPLGGASLLAPSNAHLAMLVTFFESSLFPERAPDGHVLLTAIAGGVRQPGLGTLSDQAIVDAMHGELRRLLAIDAAPVFAAVTRWAGAMPQPVDGHFERLEAVGQIEAASPRVAFAGGWRGALSISEAMSSGIRAAQRIASTI